MAYQLRTEKGLPVKHNGEDVMVANTLDVKIEGLDDKNKSFIAVASTEDEDRDKDIVRQDGWKLANFKKNPVIPWSHNYYGVPVARSVKTWVDRDGSKGPRLLFMPKFDESDDDSMKIYNKYKNGFLTSFSVGFRGIKFNFRDEEDRWWGGREFLQQELLEISSVSIPANPNANTRLGVGGEADNMVQLGYPEVFAKTNSGLFYPITDIAVFAQPKEFEVDKGIVAINAVSLDDDIKSSDPVGYVFDPELFDDKTANEWIKANAPKRNTVKYFDLAIGEDNSFTLSAVTTEDDIKLFEESIDLSDVDLSVKTSDNDFEIEVDDESDKQSSTEADEDAVPDGEAKSDVTDEPADGDSDAGEDKAQDDNASSDKSDEVSDSVTIPLKQTIEVMTTIKDSEGNIVDRSTITYGSNSEYQSVKDWQESKDNAVISLLQSTIEDLKQTISEMANQKTLANVPDIPDNDLDSGDDSEKQVTSKNDEDTYELDESLINPGSNDKTNSDEFIEIDDDLLDGSKADVKDAVNETLVEKLKRSLKEAIHSASGKID